MRGVNLDVPAVAQPVQRNGEQTQNAAQAPRLHLIWKSPKQLSRIVDVGNDGEENPQHWNGLDGKPLCKEDCKGLCPTCGKDLNEGPCGCKKELDPRLAVLAKLLDKKDSQENDEEA